MSSPRNNIENLSRSEKEIVVSSLMKLGREYKLDFSPPSPIAPPPSPKVVLSM